MAGQKELIANSRRYGQKPSSAQAAKKVRKKAADAARKQQLASYMEREARTGARAQAAAANKKPKAKLASVKTAIKKRNRGQKLAKRE